MQVYGPSHVHGPQPIQAPHATQTARPSRVEGSFSGADRVEISTAAQLIDQVRDLPEIRADRVAALRAAIADGTYETADRLDAAIENLLDEIG